MGHVGSVGHVGQTTPQSISSAFQSSYTSTSSTSPPPHPPPPHTTPHIIMLHRFVKSATVGRPTATRSLSNLMQFTSTQPQAVQPASPPVLRKVVNSCNASPRHDAETAEEASQMHQPVSLDTAATILNGVRTAVRSTTSAVPAPTLPAGSLMASALQASAAAVAQPLADGVRRMHSSARHSVPVGLDTALRNVLSAPTDLEYVGQGTRRRLSISMDTLTTVLGGLARNSCMPSWTTELDQHSVCDALLTPSLQCDFVALEGPTLQDLSAAGGHPL